MECRHTATARIEREAKSLVQFLFSKSLVKNQVVGAIRKDPTISHAVRQTALDWVDPYYLEMVKEEAGHRFEALKTTMSNMAEGFRLILNDPLPTDPVFWQRPALPKLCRGGTVGSYPGVGSRHWQRTSEIHTG
jgi:hypothetical protein